MAGNQPVAAALVALALKTECRPVAEVVAVVDEAKTPANQNLPVAAFAAKMDPVDQGNHPHSNRPADVFAAKRDPDQGNHPHSNHPVVVAVAVAFAAVKKTVELENHPVRRQLVFPS